MEKSNLDVAYDIMLKATGPMNFQNLWNEICLVQGYSEEEASNRMAKFYTNLFMDGRFITLGDNIWDLRDSYTFDKVHIDMNDVYHDEDEEEIVDEDEEESLDDEDDDDDDDEDDDDDDDFDEFEEK